VGEILLVHSILHSSDNNRDGADESLTEMKETISKQDDERPQERCEGGYCFARFLGMGHAIVFDHYII
jgi:hypothetical protein